MTPPFGVTTEVLFVGINYAPEHSGIGPYTTAAAEFLASRGLRVRVLTGLPHYPQWDVPRSDRRSSREVREGVELERFRHFVPSSQDALKRGVYELSFAAQVSRRLFIKPKTVVAVVPSLLSALVAAEIARRSSARLVVWLQDSMGAAARQSGMSGGLLVTGPVEAAERYLFKRADRTLIVSEAFRPHVEKSGAAPASVIALPNWTHITTPAFTDVTAVRRHYGWEDGETVVLHTGNMGLKQDLGRVIEAAEISRSRRLAIRYVLMGDGSQRSDLERMAKGVPGISIADPVDDRAYPELLAAADVLLINERGGVLDMSLPSKLTSYFIAGAPVLASVHPLSGTAAEVKRSGGGLVTTDQTAEQLVQGVIDIIADLDSAAAMGRRGQNHAVNVLSARAGLTTLASAVEWPR